MIPEKLYPAYFEIWLLYQLPLIIIKTIKVHGNLSDVLQ